mmetsp:Transcript_44659/g.93054  ORF Transcript_44659/g.93054 Transcript_44659/m.93054 type:complete len:82 (+) Transcript_44659:97-342(+)
MFCRQLIAAALLMACGLALVGAIPDMLRYAANGFYQDACHLCAFAIGVFLCHTALPLSHSAEPQSAEGSRKIRVPLFLLYV